MRMPMLPRMPRFQRKPMSPPHADHVTHREYVGRVVLEAVMGVVGREPDRARGVDDVETDARRGTRAKRKVAEVDRAALIREHVAARVPERTAADAGDHAAGMIDFKPARIERAKCRDFVADARFAFGARRCAVGARDADAETVELVGIEMEPRLSAP